MEKKIKLNPKEINEWKGENWSIYASQNWEKLGLRMWVNNNGWFKVVRGGDILYEGTQITHAIAAWDAA